MNLAEAAQFMRDNQILHLKTVDFEITMHPDAFVSGKKREIPLDDKPDPKWNTEVGRTGVTRAYQKELYGQVFEDDFRNLPTPG
jgi:hypothetical protein